MAICNEDCNLQVENTEVDALIKKLIREVTELTKDTESRLLEQNEKIADLCLFLRENVSTSIREVIDTLDSNGSLTEMLTNIINEEYTYYIDDLKAKIITPEIFGACGDGITDDTTAIQNAINYANDHGRVVYLSSKTYIITRPLVLDGCSLIGCVSNIFNTAGSIIRCKTKDFTAIKQGSTTTGDIMFNMSNVLVENALVGYDITYAINSKFENLYALNCDTGIKLGTLGSVGSMFNEFNNLYTRGCRIGIDSVSTNYFNNNVFNNGFIEGSEFAMRLEVDSGYGAINNVFNNVEFRSTRGRGIILNSTINTIFNHCYFECGANSVRLEDYSNITLNECIYGSYKIDNAYTDYNTIYAIGGANITINGGVVFLTEEYENKYFYDGLNEGTYENITIMKPVSKNGSVSGFKYFKLPVKEHAIKQEEQVTLTGTIVAKSGEYTEVEFTYPKEFSSIPNVVTATLRGSNNIVSGVTYLISDRTATGGKISIYNSGTSDRSVSFSVYAKIV